MSRARASGRPAAAAAAAPSARVERFLTHARHAPKVAREVTVRGGTARGATGSPGIFGRLTGIPMPTTTALDENGFPSIDQFFGPGGAADSGLDDSFESLNLNTEPLFGVLSPGSPTPSEREQIDADDGDAPMAEAEAEPAAPAPASAFAAAPAVLRTPPRVEPPQVPAAGPSTSEAFRKTDKLARTPPPPSAVAAPAPVPPQVASSSSSSSSSSNSVPIGAPPGARSPSPVAAAVDDEPDAGDDAPGDEPQPVPTPEKKKPKTPSKKKAGKRKGADAADAKSADGDSKESPAKKPRTGARGKGVGRPTSAMVDLEKSTQLFRQRQQEAEARARSDGGDGTHRRSGRQRLAPLAFWKSERIIYTRADAVDPNQPPVPDIAATLKLKAELTTPPPKPKKPRVVKGDDKHSSSKKSGSGKSKKTGKSSGRDAVAAADVDDAQPDVEAEVNVGDVKEKRVVAKYQSAVDLEPLMDDDEEQNGNLDAKHGGAKASAKPRVLAGKSFEEEGFSMGTLQLQPGASKPPEFATLPEALIIADCAPGKLEATIGTETFKLSRGAHFHVPKGNTYELRNTDKRQSATINFIVLKNAPAAADAVDGGAAPAVDPRQVAAAARAADAARPGTVEVVDDSDDDDNSAEEDARKAKAKSKSKSKSPTRKARASPKKASPAKAAKASPAKASPAAAKAKKNKSKRA